MGASLRLSPMREARGAPRERPMLNIEHPTPNDE
jgi:hypothetical protein